jgi:hybrid polyketide synthase/nonribosomal peptide synthetase ACE1
MAGELGQSLAGWMISRGAQYIVLTSRTPRVHPKFVDEMRIRYGAVVRAVPLDITSPESLRSVHAAMSASLPPIAGVINGAMILDDELFVNMTHEQFTRVTKPKVVGTLLLDELFYNDASLDFFVVASSIASIIGWSGQSNYSAANEFMTSLVNKRRKRGVAASVMNIPAVLGVGYAAHSDTFSFDYFQSLGYINIGEEDLHILLAEAILSGRPGRVSDGNAQVAMGVDYIPADLYVKEAHRRDVKFNHFIRREESGSEAQTVTAGERVRVQLQSANGPDAAYTIIRDALVIHLKRMLRMTEEDKLEESVGLVDQGVDSLVAVDIRAWFLKELDVDVPTLKIMGGASIANLVETAVENMPQFHEGGRVESPAGKEVSSPFPIPAKPEGGFLRPRSERAPTISTPLSSGSPVFTPVQITSPSTSGIDSGRTSPPRDYFDKGSGSTGKEKAVIVVVDELGPGAEV